MSANSIDSDSYVDGSIDNAHLADDAVDSDEIAAAAVDFANIQNVAANSILGRNADSSGVLSEVALTTTQILIGDGTGFTAAPLSGDATMTNAGAVTVASAAADFAVVDDLSLTSDSAVFNMGAGNDFTITHDGTTGATLAGNPITITAGGASTWSTSAGALTITSAAALNLASDNVDQTVNIATAGTRTVNIGIDDGTDKTTINMLAAMHIDSTPDDTVYSGITASFTAGEALEVGEVVYLKASDSRVWKAVSVVSGTGLISAEIMCMGMVAVAQGSAGSAVTILLQGFLQSTASFPTYAVGETLYVPEAEVGSKNVPEGVSPDTDGDFVQVVGWAAGADTVYFNPDFTIIEHA